MAVSPEADRSFVGESVQIPDVPSRFACPYFGSGRWSCPSQCPNVEAAQRNFLITEKEASLQCRIVANPPDDFLLENCRNIGVECRTPEQPSFLRLPLRVINEN